MELQKVQMMTLCLPDHYLIEVSFWTSLQFLAAKMSHFCIFSLKVFCVAVTSTNFKTTFFFKLFYIFFAIEFLHIVAHICSSHALFTRLYYDCTHSKYTVLNFITAPKAHLYLQKFILQAQPVSHLVTSPKILSCHWECDNVCVLLLINLGFIYFPL